jgi:hypothetical protein
MSVTATSAGSDRAIQQMRDDMNGLRGRLFALTDVSSLTENQQKAMKSLIRHLTYDSQTRLEATLRERT